jgi:hypothetical protein
MPIQSEKTEHGQRQLQFRKVAAEYPMKLDIRLAAKLIDSKRRREVKASSTPARTSMATVPAIPTTLFPQTNASAGRTHPRLRSAGKSMKVSATPSKILTGPGTTRSPVIGMSERRTLYRTSTAKNVSRSSFEKFSSGSLTARVLRHL